MGPRVRVKNGMEIPKIGTTTHTYPQNGVPWHLNTYVHYERYGEGDYRGRGCQSVTVSGLPGRSYLVWNAEERSTNSIIIGPPSRAT